MVPNALRAAARRALLALLCSIATVRCSPAPPADAANSDGLLGELARSGLARTIAPRLSIPAEYRPCTLRTPPDGTIPHTECEGDRVAAASTDRILDLAAHASAQVRAEVDPGALHTAALIDLLWADGAGNSLQRSISYLQSAARLADRPAPVLADLAAAYLVRAERAQNPRDLLEAIEAAAAALEQEPGSAAARFNLALALDRIALDGQAAGAWRQYLMVDSTSGWAMEARRRSQALAEVHEPPVAPPLGASAAEVAAYVARAPQEARLLGWDRLLGEWGEAVLAGDSARAEERLRLAEAIGEALEGQGGDATLADAVRAIRAVTNDRVAVQTLARAHRDYAAAQVVYREGHYAAARHPFERAVDSSAESPVLDLWARLFRGATLAYAGHMEAAEQITGEVVARTDSVRHPSLAGRARWHLGTILLRRGRYEQALQAYRAAAGLLAQAGEHEHLGAVESLAMQTEYTLGNAAGTYEAMHRSLMTLREYRRSIWLHTHLWVAAQAAAAEGLVHTALRIQAEDIAVAARTGRPLDLAEARLARARLLATLGRGDRAAADVKAARNIVERLEPGIQRSWLEADLRLAEAAASIQDEPVRAAAALDSVVAFFETLRAVPRLSPALVARAAAQLAIGEPASALTDLDRAIALLDEQRATILSTQLRTSLSDAARRIIDQIVLLHVAADRQYEALVYLEKGRASLAPARSADDTPASERIRVPPGQIALDYALVGDTLLIWTVTDTLIHFTRTQVDSAQLIRTIDRARTALELRTDEAATRSDLARLYNWLVRPVEERLGRGGASVVVVADGEIAGVPFAALYDTARARYLVEDHAVRHASSLREVAPPQGKSTAQRARILLVADPEFEGHLLPGLRRLPGAAAEIEAVAVEYPSSEVLAGAAANAAAMQVALRQAEIVHYAGHAVFDDVRPERSFLVLAPEGEAEGAGLLTAADLQRLDLRHVRLVVLSACQTLPSRSGRSGGFTGFTQALLAAGAAGVVGSLWRVDDQLTRPLMIEFHRAYRESGDGAAALRAAQLRLLRSPDPTLQSPAAWAGFRYAGR